MSLFRVDFSDVEIDVFFGNSDTDGDGTIDTVESNGMLDSVDSDAESDEESSKYSSRYGYLKAL